MTLAGGLALALASTVAINWGWVAQHDAAGGLPPLSLRRPVASLRSLFANPRWLAGFVAGLGGWAVYVAALRLAPLSLVQAVSAGGVALIAALSGVRGRRDLAAVAVGVFGLVLLGASLAGGGAPAGHAASWTAVASWLAVAAVAAALLAGRGARLLAPGAGLGLAAGVLYAAGDVATKFAVAGGAHALLAPAVPAAHGLAFVCVQLAFQRGSALATAGTASLLTNALPIAAGIVLFGERVPGGALGGLRVAAFACVVAGAFLLARKDDQRVEGASSQRAPIPAAIAAGAASAPSAE